MCPFAGTVRKELVPDKMALGALEGSSPQRSPSLIVPLVSAGVLAQSQGRDWLVSIAVQTPHCPSPAEVPVQLNGCYIVEVNSASCV